MLCKSRVLSALAGSALTSSEASAAFTHPASSSSIPKNSEAVQKPATPLEQLVAHVYFENPLVGLGVHHVAVGTVKKELSAQALEVHMRAMHLSPMAEVGSRIYVRVGLTATHTGRVIGGTVARVNSNGTLGILLDTNVFEPSVSQSTVCFVECRSSMVREEGYQTLLEWVCDAGVRRHADQERLCAALYQRGWRAENMYMLEAADVHCMTYLKRSVRMVVLEKAEWQRLHHAEMRTMLQERIKEKEWRYFIQKFSGFISANWAGLGVISVFLWNFKNYRKQQREYQLKLAVSTLTNKSATSRQRVAEEKQFVSRPTEEETAREILRRLTLTRPRIAVLTGFRGCGKSMVFRTVAQKTKLPVLFVEVRNSEDVLGCILRTMKVSNVDACGNHTDFINDAFRQSTVINKVPPLVFIKLREGTKLSRVYDEAVALACDRKLCHLVIEVPLESLTMANLSLPRTDFYTIPNFSKEQAFAYTQHGIDPVSFEHFVEVMGTNSNDIDELFTAMQHRRVPPVVYTTQKLAKAIRLVQAAWAVHPELKKALQQLAQSDYNVGQHIVGDHEGLSAATLADFALYDPVQDRWLFTHKVLHTATRCCM